jgi:hypothetical protein
MVKHNYDESRAKKNTIRIKRYKPTPKEAKDYQRSGASIHLYALPKEAF